jgi:flagellar hook-associated protein 2
VATISSPGLGSGLDVSSIVNQLVAIERQPITRLQTQAKSIQAKLSSFGTLQSLFSTLGDAARKLSSADFWKGTVATSADPTAVRVAGGGTAAGSYAIEVAQLARAQSLSSPVYGSKDTVVGGGTLQFTVGRWSQDLSTFDASAAAPVSVAIAATDTLAQIRDKVNAAGAGVTATIVNDATGARLVFRSASGEDQALRVAVTDDDGNHADATGLSALGFDPQNGAGAMTQDQAARNALATVNGLPIVSASNDLSGVVDGLSLQLLKETSAPVEVSLATDTAAMKTAIGDFVKAYNDLQAAIATQTKYDSGTQTAAVLQGDRTALMLQRQLRDAVQRPSDASSLFERLSSLGIEVQKDGALKLDDRKLSTALADDLPEAIKAFSANSGAVQGFAVAVRELASQVTGFDGAISSRTEAFSASIQRNRREQDRLEDRVEATRERLLRQYSALDTRLAQLNGLSTYVTQQMAVLTASLKSGS